MANQEINNNEINLSQLSDKVKGYFSRLSDAAFDGILFLKKYIIIIVLLVAGGATLGYFKDVATHSYTQQVYVIPNFGSTDYVYSEIERLNSKIIDRDTASLKELGIKNTTRISSIEIVPVADLYNFVDNGSNNLSKDESRRYDVFRLVAEAKDLNKVLEDPITGKNFKQHLITIKTGKKFEESELIEPLLKHLNQNPYYKQLQQPYAANLERTIAVNDSTIKQIDGILNEFGNGTKPSSNVVFAGESGLDEVIALKNKLLKEQEQNRVSLINYTDVVKNASSLLNTRVKNITSGKMKILYPLLFVLAFVALMRFIKFYKAQVTKRKQA